MGQTIYRGQVWQYEAQDPSASLRGSIQHGSRPVIIVSNNLGNKYSPTALVVPCTGQINKKANLPTHARITICGRPSLAEAEQCTPVNISDLKYKKCNLSPEEMAKVDHIIAVAFGLCPIPGKKAPAPQVSAPEEVRSDAIDKFYKRYPQLVPAEPGPAPKPRNHWDKDTITRFIWDCGELSPRAVREKYNLSQKSVDNYFTKFTQGR